MFSFFIVSDYFICMVAFGVILLWLIDFAWFVWWPYLCFESHMGFQFYVNYFYFQSYENFFLNFGIMGSLSSSSEIYLNFYFSLIFPGLLQLLLSLLLLFIVIIITIIAKILIWCLDFRLCLLYVILVLCLPLILFKVHSLYKAKINYLNGLFV